MKLHENHPSIQNLLLGKNKHMIHKHIVTWHRKARIVEPEDELERPCKHASTPIDINATTEEMKNCWRQFFYAVPAEAIYQGLNLTVS
jgi:hypothetical protein